MSSRSSTACGLGEWKHGILRFFTYTPQTPTDFKDPYVVKATTVHPTIDEESVVADGNGGVALTGGG